MERPAKRQKFENQQEFDFPRVSRPDHIHQWLEFQQTTDPSVKEGINTFKNYLVFIHQLEDVSLQSKQLRILKEYCEWQKAPSDDQLNFYDILSTWSLATENNVEATISAIPAALAQFLKTISGTLELRSFGLALIDSLLRRDQSKLFEKCLVSPRTKPHLASPCLRLLTEMINFDAGERINEIWARREIFMQKFDVSLEQHNSSTDLQERRKPSVRRMALRLLLVMLKYMNVDARLDLLGQARVLHACLRGLMFDGDDIVSELLQSLDTNIVSTMQIPRAALVKFFNSNRLENLASLYRFDIDDDSDVGETAKTSIRDLVHKILLHLCTTDQGVLLPDRGWYPPFSNSKKFRAPEEDFIDLGLDSPFHTDEYTDGVPVTNTTMSLFISRLRPNEDALQSQLLLQILRAAPELVAEYFIKHKSLPLASSDDVTWRGGIAFLFSVIESAIPKSFGHSNGRPQDPPPQTIVVESILPKPLDRAYLEKLVNSNDDLLKISGARILTVVLKKLRDVLAAFSSFSDTNNYLWKQASNKLSDLVEARIPPIREVLLALRHTPQTSTTSYTALLECISTYYQVLSNVAVGSTFDIGPVMTELCSVLEKESPDAESFSSTVEQLSYATRIAELSSSTRWLHKANNDILSPLGRILQVTVQSTQEEAQSILQTVNKVLVYRGVLNPDSRCFAALRSSLTSSKRFSPSPELFLFLDNCITRANQKPVKYLDDIENASQIVSDRKPLSLFVGAIAEQWSFACRKYEGRKSAIKTIAMWITRLFSLLDSAGENYRIMSHFYENMLRDSNGKSREYLEAAIEKTRKKPVTIEAEVTINTALESKEDQQHIVQTNNDSTTNNLQALTQTRIPIPETLHNLDKWPTTLDIELEIRTDRLPKLILCMASPSEEIRLQTFQLLQSITHTVDTHSSYEGKSQIHLLLGETIETIRQYGLSKQAPPTLIPELTNTLLHILIDPTHRLYTKANRFLLHSPSWTPKRTLTYWLEKILLREPDAEEPDAFPTEVHWLLTWLLNSLRTPLDLDLYRRAGLWERLLSLYASPALIHTKDTKGIRRLILAMLWQACTVEGGADILWTRFGVDSWLDSMAVLDAENEREIEMVREKMREMCDGGMVERWKVGCALNRKKVQVDTEMNGDDEDVDVLMT